MTGDPWAPSNLHCKGAPLMSRFLSTSAVHQQCPFRRLRGHSIPKHQETRPLPCQSQPLPGQCLAPVDFSPAISARRTMVYLSIKRHMPHMAHANTCTHEAHTYQASPRPPRWPPQATHAIPGHPISVNGHTHGAVYTAPQHSHSHTPGVPGAVVLLLWGQGSGLAVVVHNNLSGQSCAHKCVCEVEHS